MNAMATPVPASIAAPARREALRENPLGAAWGVIEP